MNWEGLFMIQQQYKGQKKVYLTILPLAGGLPIKVASLVAVADNMIMVPLKLTLGGVKLVQGFKDGVPSEPYWTCDTVVGEKAKF